MRIDLTTEEAQMVINALAARPYAEVANIIPKIMLQARKQTEAQVPAPADSAEDAEALAVAAE